MPRWRYIFLYSGGLFFELASLIVILVVIGVLINYFLFSITPIKGASMEPNFFSGDWTLINKSSYIKNSPKRGDVVGLRFPGDPNSEKYIKRVIGLPKEQLIISGGKIFINSVELKEGYLPKDTFTIPDLSVQLHEDQYFLIGDNRNNSSDSRIWGPASKKEFIGRVIFVIFPFKNYQYISQPSY
ncbi:MAG: signal peptidase I [bacterium]|nr:signal peptidase I [bacterium]